MTELGSVAPQEDYDGDAAPVAATKIVIPYKPREHFKRLHNSTKRFKFVCAHRRAGKSVSEINEMVKKLLQNTRQYPPPRYAYIGPSFAQTKDLIWEYLKHYTSTIPGMNFSESELEATFPTGARITLYGGAAAYERMRGMYYDGAVLDEFPLLNPAVFSTVVRPCLADYRGWAVVSGTSNGDDHFHELKKKAEREPALWDVIIIPVTETDALHPDEVIEMTKDMTPEEYAREMLCAFDAPIDGAYYASLINEAQSSGRITGVPYDPRTPVITWWDLGIRDSTSIWFIQVVGREVHVIDYVEHSGKSLVEYARILAEKGYMYGSHVLPPDIMARELGSGRSRFEILSELLDAPIIVSPQHKVEDGIAAVRSMLPMCWFDKDKTAAGVSCLRNYHVGKLGKPVHNWASHGSDAFRIGSVAFEHTTGYMSSSNVTPINAPLRRKTKGIV